MDRVEYIHDTVLHVLEEIPHFRKVKDIASGSTLISSSNDQTKNVLVIEESNIFTCQKDKYVYASFLVTVI